MIYSFKTKVKNFVDQRIKEVKKHQSSSQQTSLDFAQISKLFPESNFIPFTSWTISPSVILHILNDIVINKRRNIIEFGSGASTLYMARLIQTLKLDTKLYSVESNEEWMKKMEDELSLYNLQGIVTLIHAPLTKAPKNICLKGQELWYCIDSINEKLGATQEFDLVVVDGPFGGSTPFARYSAIPFLKSRLSNNWGVFLDDSRRDDEREIANLWAKALEVNPEFIHRYVYLTNNLSFETKPYTIPAK